MFQRLLVPLDGSPLAEQALPVATRLAQASGGTIILLHAVDVLPMSISYGVLQPALTQEVIERYLTEARDSLDRYRKSLAGIPVEAQVMVEDPGTAILSVVDERAVDLVVMSSHGYTGIKRWLLGSVAEKVVHHAPVPVLLLHKGQPLAIHQRPDGSQRVRALVPLDTSARAQDAIAPAAALVAALSSPGAGELHLTQIVPVPQAVSEGERETLRQQAEQNLQAISESIRAGLVANYGPDLRLTVTWSISLERDIAEGIVTVAEHGGQAEIGAVAACDLIAMTTHGSTGIRKWTMGTIAERVLHATPLPLLLVRPADMIVADSLAKQHQEQKDQTGAAK